MRFDAEMWMHTGEAAWHLVTLPHEIADSIENLQTGRGSGFGSVRVVVTVGATTWRTSVFPDTSTRSYLLPVKRSVRQAEGLDDGDLIDVTLELADRQPRPQSSP